MHKPYFDRRVFTVRLVQLPLYCRLRRSKWPNIKDPPGNFVKIIDLLAVGKLKLAEEICKGQVCEHSYGPYEDDAVD
jgi:hypothetical protein